MLETEAAGENLALEASPALWALVVFDSGPNATHAGVPHLVCSHGRIFAHCCRKGEHGILLSMCLSQPCLLQLQELMYIGSHTIY